MKGKTGPKRTDKSWERGKTAEGWGSLPPRLGLLALGMAAESGLCAQEIAGRGVSEICNVPGGLSFGGDNLSALLRRVKDEASPLYLQAG